MHRFVFTERERVLQALASHDVLRTALLLPGDKTLVVVKSAEENIETGLKKFGAMLGDCVEVGCNSVLNPGTVIGRHTNVYPLSRVRGFIPENSIFKDQEHIVLKEDRG